MELLENERLLEEVVHEIATRTKTARRIVRKTGLPQAVGVAKQEAAAAQTTANEAKAAARDAGGVTNDNVAPLAPSGVGVTVFEHNLSISWVPPAASEYVEKTRVRITPAGGTAIIRTTKDTYYIAAELAPNVVHDIEVQFEDRWGLTSGWSPPVQATPEPLIAEQIAASVQVAAAQISGQLGNDQIAQIANPAKLAEAVYQTAVERGGRGANLFPFDKAEASSWAVGALPQRGYAYLTSAGRTAGVVAHGSDQWWQVVSDATPTTETFVGLHASWENPPLGGDAYVYSAMVKNVGATQTTARVSIQEATDAAGTGTVTKHGSAVTVPADGKIYRVFIRFANDKTRPFKRLFQYIGAGASTLLFGKFQLEEVSPDQLGPGRYTMPVVNAGALSARLLAAWDLTAVRAIVGDLTVESAKIADAAISAAKIADATITSAKIMDAQITSAKIASIVADKIASGTLSATTIALGAGGALKAGAGTTIDNEGIKLAMQASYDTKAWTGTNKVSSPLESVSLMFYSNTNTAVDGAYRGAILRADGEPVAAGSRVGAVVLHATQAGTINASSGRVEVLAGVSPAVGVVNLYQDVGVNRDLDVARNITANGRVGAGNFEPQMRLASTVVAAGTSILVTHNLGVYPAVIMAYSFNVVGTSNPNGITPLPTPDSNMYVWDNTTADFKVWNGNTTSRNVIARIFK